MKRSPLHVVSIRITTQALDKAYYLVWTFPFKIFSNSRIHTYDTKIIVEHKNQLKKSVSRAYLQSYR